MCALLIRIHLHLVMIHGVFRCQLVRAILDDTTNTISYQSLYLKETNVVPLTFLSLCSVGYRLVFRSTALVATLMLNYTLI